jgi:predicted alpha-1,2-mannosidase
MKCATQQTINRISTAGYLKRIFFSISLFAIVQVLPAQSLVSYVQPLSGTASSTTLAAQKHSEAGSEQNANTIPAVGLPFGMTQWTAQTRTTEQKCMPPYFYKDSLLSGFRGTHWISGSCTQDYGSLTIMPVTGRLKTTNSAVPFSHSNEVTTSAYYKIDLSALHLTTEISATARCGIMQFTVQQADSLYLLIMPNSDRGEGFVQIDKARGEIWGYNPAHRIYQGWGEPAGFSGYFFIRIERKTNAQGVFSGSEIFSKDSISCQKELGAFVGFNMKKGESLVIRIGTSFCSIDGARKNLQAEMPISNFSAVAASAKKVWEKALAQISVQTKNKRDKRIFYTALYHAFQHPRLYNDVDGSYPKFSGSYEMKKKAGDYYDDFSMWDIYRAQLPLLEILQPQRVNHFVQSLILKGEQGGWLPIFPCWNNYTAAMIGDHATAFIASAFANGIRAYDVQAAYGLMRQNAFDSPSPKEYSNGKGRRALSSYLRYGYIPLEDSVPEAFHKKEQVSRTLEYAYDDYALSVVAKALNKKEDYPLLQQRALNYRNVFDTTVRMVRGRYADGRWVEPFKLDNREFYITEGTPRQYSFYVPQDMKGLVSLMGGKKVLENALDSLFQKGEYWHGNEPGHQIPFLYNYSAAPWKTQQQVRKILNEEYSDGPGGLSGNDDAGQMSAWYVFAAMGFYPVDPVSGEYQLCSPLFDQVSIHLPNGKVWKIICHKTSDDAMYIDKLLINGKAYQQHFIRHSDLVKGGQMDVYLSSRVRK